MRINTPENIIAKFFMRDEEPDANIFPHVSPSQVHGKNILVVDEKNILDYALPNKPQADGILLTAPNCEASLKFADCAPVLLWGKNFVMILHSGYKGTVLNIAGAGLELVKNNFILGAWVGPCIGKNYFRKINDEWTQTGIKNFHEKNFCVDGEKVFFDLAGEIKSQLIEKGLASEKIILSGIDTLTSPECYSYRRGDITKRMTLHVKLFPA